MCFVKYLQDLLAMVPRPVKAVLMLFPISDATEAAQAEEEARLKDNGQEITQNLWFMKQTISNACGTIAMLHAFANDPNLEAVPNSFLDKFIASSKDMDPAQRARLLEHPREGEPDIEQAHQDAAQGGQTAPPDEDEQVKLFVRALLLCLMKVYRPVVGPIRFKCGSSVSNGVQVLLHFVCFVEKDGHLYELDGRKFAPINHGPTSPDNLLENSCKTVKKLMNETDNIRFTLMALAPA
jgi:ubiquitin carboxyl-terminal hydrolase L3